MKKKTFFSYLGGPGGALCRTQVNENFRAVRPHHRANICITREKITASFSYMGHNIQKCVFLVIRGALGGSLCRTQVNENFRAVRPHHRANICITREKNNSQFFIYGPHFWLFRGPGLPINNRTGPILLPSYPLTYINLHIKYGSNPIRIF